MKTKHIIKVKDGRAYLHWSAKVGGIVHEGVEPLGNDLKLIQIVKMMHKCRIVFLD